MILRAGHKEIITIAGSPGSGKSSTAKGVAAALGYGHFSSGDFFRQLATDRGMTVEELNRSLEGTRELDGVVDGKLEELGKTREKLVIDSRMAWHWIPDSFKIYLLLDEQTAAERIFANIRRHGRVSEHALSVEELRESVARRFASEQKRYHELYGADPTDLSNYDLVIDTKRNDLAQAIALALSSYEAWRAQPQQV